MKNKKILIIILEVVGALALIVILFFLFGNNKKTVCTLTSNQSKNGYKLESKYEINSKGNIVKTVEVIETITSKDKETLDKFEKQFKDQYEFNKKTYKGYTYKITNNGSKVVATVTINYKDFDMDKFIKNNEAMKQYTKNNKLTLDGAKRLYESSGATCK